MGVPSFLRVENTEVYYKGEGELAIVIPEVFFERNHAIIEGEITHVIGLLNYAILKKDTDKIEKNIKRFNYPSAFSTKPGRVEKVKNFKVKESSKPADYRIYYYKDNNVDQVIVSTEVPEDLANVEEFFAIFVTTGKVPAGIRYEDLYTYFEDSMNANGASFKMNMQEFGLIVSEFARDPDDMSKPFRLSKKLDTDPYSYQVFSIKELAKMVSPFTAMVTEDWNDAVLSASLIDDKDIIDTPLEPVLTGSLK